MCSVFATFDMMMRDDVHISKTNLKVTQQFKQMFRYLQVFNDNQFGWALSASLSLIPKYKLR